MGTTEEILEWKVIFDELSKKYKIKKEDQEKLVFSVFRSHYAAHAEGILRGYEKFEKDLKKGFEK